MAPTSHTPEPVDKVAVRTPAKRMFSGLESLGRIRDGILVSGAVFYGVGYLIWSFHAWENNLGFLPALDLQYFVAGIVPTLIIVLSIWFGRWLYTFVRYTWPKLVGEDASGIFRWIRYFLIGSLGLAFFLFIFGSNPTIALILLAFVLLGWFGTSGRRSAKPAKWRSILIVVIFVGLLAALFFQDYLNEHVFGFAEALGEQSWVILLLYFAALLAPEMKAGAIFDWLKVVYFGLTVILLPILGILFYVEEVYPNLPQEFGGVSPRCARLDFETDKLSPEIQMLLTPFSGEVDTNRSVTRTMALKVYYANDKILIVKRLAEKEDNSLEEVHEIKKADVHTITWCDLEE